MLLAYVEGVEPSPAILETTALPLRHTYTDRFQAFSPWQESNLRLLFTKQRLDRRATRALKLVQAMGVAPTLQAWKARVLL